MTSAHLYIKPQTKTIHAFCVNSLTALIIGLQYTVNGKTMLYAVPVLIKNYITAAGTHVNRGNLNIIIPIV